MRVVTELLIGYWWALPLVYWAFGVLFYFATLPDELDKLSCDNSLFSGNKRGSLNEEYLELYECLARKEFRIGINGASTFLIAFGWPLDLRRLHRIKKYLTSPILFGSPCP